MAEAKSFQVWDYLVFAAVLVISASIGVYHGCTGGKQRTTSEILLANRAMAWPPVAMSLLATFMSAITLLGTPTETYMYGTMYWWIWIGYGLMVPITAHVLMPTFYRLGITSVYEYLEIRFKSKSLRVLSACIYVIQMILYLAIVLYAPSMALNQVTGLNVWISVCTVGIVCTFYTAIGGMKAVMWTDTFQIAMMFAGLFAVLIQGSINKGGFHNIWADNIASGRVYFDDFDFSPLKRHSFWSLTIGGCFTWLSIYGINQAQVQRALSTKSLRQAQLAFWINFPGLTLIMTITGLCGMVIYSEYKDCDPIGNKDVSAPDQLLPFYVIQKLSHVPGLPGLFVACVMSGTLSTISSGLNSLAAVILQDLIRSTRCGREMSEARAATVTKTLAAVLGLVCIALTVVASYMGSILQAALALFGVISGPILGLFFLGMCVPFANWIGAMAGLLSGLGMGFWVAIGAQVTKPYNPKKPLSTAGCISGNYTLFNQTTTSSIYHTTSTLYPESHTDIHEVLPEHSKDGLMGLYSLSYLHYSTMAVIIVLVVGTIVSLITGRMDPEEVPPKTINTLADAFCSCCSGSYRNRCRFGVPEVQEEYDEKKYVIEGEEMTEMLQGKNGKV